MVFTVPLTLGEYCYSNIVEMRPCIFFIVFIGCSMFVHACKTMPEKTEQEQASSPCCVFTAQPQKQKDVLHPSGEKKGSVEVAYEVLVAGNHGKGLTTSVLETQEELDRLYALIYGGKGVKAPKIDFTRKKVAAVFAGPFNTGGYGIKLYSAMQTKNTLEAVFHVTAPGPSEIVTQAFTTPCLIVSMDVPPSTRISIKTQGPVTKKF